MTGAVFEPVGDAFQPQPVSRSGWGEEVLHGGPVAALFVHQMERVPAPVPMQVARLTVDMFRPVPTSPLTVTTQVSREGRRIQTLEASMTSDGVEVARATMLRIRSDDLAVPDHPTREPLPDPDGLPVHRMVHPMPEHDEDDWFHTRGVEMRLVSGDIVEPGPATVWMRLTVPIVSGEEPSPTQRAVAVADFPNGISRVLPPGWLYINPDLTVHFARPPDGEWIALGARTDITGGVGLAQADLFDTAGAFGHCLQSLLVAQGY
ncbi:MAG: thioesterase family protein [Acidimicrobiia bacterium]